ncbi:MAG: hypothetical protein NTU91_17295 [Chloroflexi bacterium]|jgi:hypothetical protein|nr:hypothetical protein [Chloroflexota bacterium]
MKPALPPTQSPAPAKKGTRWAERLLLGGMLALALFSFEAGLAHIALARNDACRASLASSRVAPAEGYACMSELALAATNAFARGPAGALLQEKMTLASWALSGALYAMLGGASAQLAPGRAVLSYLGIHAFVLVVVCIIMFIGPHVIV